MNEHFDDMIRRRLQSHESIVPEGLFDAIQSRPEVQDALFDDAVRHKLITAESAIPQGMFAALQTTVDLEHLPFDTAVQDKLENAESEVPANMWQRITTEKERRRRPVAWWWMAAAALLILAGTGTVLLLKTKKQPAATIITTHNKKMAEQPGSISLLNPVQKNEFDVDKDSKKAVELKQETTNGTTDAAGNHQNEVNIPVLTSTYPNTVKYQSVVTAEQVTVRKNFASQHGVTAKQEDDAALNLQSGNAVQIVADVSLATAHLYVLELIRNAGRFAPGQLLKAKPHAPVIPCPTNGDEKQNDWYVEAYGSGFLLQKNIQDKAASKNAKAGFDTTLHQQVSFNAGFNLIKSLGHNFLLKTGLQYNRINESFRLTQINERRLVTIISVRTVIIAPGDTVRIRDTATIEQIGTAQRRTQNRYTQWDIPVIIGYEFNGENMRLNVNAGIIANIRSSYRGEMLADSTKQIYDINNYNGQPIYRKTIGFSLYAGLSILKPLTEKMSLLIEPHARIGLSNTANNQSWFSQKNSTMGLSFGLRYKLGRSRQRIY